MDWQEIGAGFASGIATAVLAAVGAFKAKGLPKPGPEGESSMAELARSLQAEQAEIKATLARIEAKQSASAAKEDAERKVLESIRSDMKESTNQMNGIVDKLINYLIRDKHKEDS